MLDLTLRRFISDNKYVNNILFGIGIYFHKKSAIIIDNFRMRDATVDWSVLVKDMELFMRLKVSDILF